MGLLKLKLRFAVVICLCWMGSLSFAAPGTEVDLTITFDTPPVQPEAGVPLEARRSGLDARSEDTEPSIEFTPIQDTPSHGALSQRLGGAVATVEVTWADPQKLDSEQDTDTFLRRLLTHSSGSTYSYIPWAQMLGVPTVATTVRHRQGQAGQWLVWYGWPSVYSAYQDGSGTWWFSVWFEDEGVRLTSSDGTPTTSHEVEPAPVLVVYERDPWLWVPGSDSPVFALYEDGLLIVRSDQEEPRQRFRHTSLTAQASAELLERLALVDSIGGFNGQMLDVSDGGSVVTYELHHWIGGQPAGVAIYGYYRDLPAVKEKIPEKIVGLFDILLDYPLDDGEFWFPEQVEVLVWPYDHSPEEPLPWPDGWPTPTADDLENAEAGFSLFLEQEQFEAFLDLLGSQGSNQAIGFQGRKWSMDYRIPFPAGF